MFLAVEPMRADMMSSAIRVSELFVSYVKTLVRARTIYVPTFLRLFFYSIRSLYILCRWDAKDNFVLLSIFN